MKVGAVYKVTCGKTFIVGSSINHKKRKNTYLNKLKNNSYGNRYLQNSYNKYGNFTFQILQDNIPENILLNVEDIWMGALCSKIQDKKSGANTKDANKPIQSKETIEKFRSKMIGRKQSKERKEAQSLRMKGKEPSMAIRTNMKITYKYSLNGNFIEEFESATKAAFSVNGSPSRISEICVEEKGTYLGFQWRYYKKNNISSTIIGEGTAHHKKVIQKNLNGEIIKIWDSIKQIAENGFNRASISSVCNKHSFKYKNFLWEFEKPKKKE